MKSFFLFITICSLASCSDGKYKMYDIAYDKYISVDNLIENGDYTPEICNTNLDRIFKTKTPTVDTIYANQLNKLLDKWATAEESYRLKNGDSTFFSHNENNICSDTKYQYSYLLAEKPMHVFSTCITVRHYKEMDYFSLFIRIDDNGEIVGEYTDNQIVQNTCDKAPNCPVF